MLHNGSHFVKQSRTFCAILVVSIMRKVSVKLFEFVPMLKEQMTFKDIFSSNGRNGAAEQNSLCNLVEGIMRNMSVGLY